ncbi:MAG TPA: hypothetical protein VMR70_21370 [Flavisolibacter sp.]|nr:hypothetical protein [Flavisolibacter sp.]
MKYTYANTEFNKEKFLPGKRQLPIDILTANAWLCAYASLWKTASFSEKEVRKTTDLIEDHLTSASSPLKAYNLFCQRVLLTHYYLRTHPESYVPVPSQWLDKNNVHGYAGTKKWIDKLLEQRASLPFYRIELKAFAEALLEMATEPCPANFAYWKNYFAPHPELLDLFLTSVALQQFQCIPV